MDIDQATDTPHNSQSLQTLIDGPLSSSLSRLTTSSRAIPSNKDFHFFYNFDEFKLPVQEIVSRSQSLLESIGSSNQIFKEKLVFPGDVDIDDAYDWLVNVNDEIFERFDGSIDEFQRVRKEEGSVPVSSAEVDDGFQLVAGKKKKVSSGSNVGSGSRSGGLVGESGVKVADKKGVVTGGKAKIPFHIPTIKRPQEEFNILVNNVNQPFEHVWLEQSEDGWLIHPLEKLDVLDFVDKVVVEPVPPPPFESSPFKYVEEVKGLRELAAKLRGVNEFAVDLEHNQYRSFQGLTCLMQISTRTEDFVVDTLKLRVHIGPHLRDVFKDPNKKKVMHGADRDILWLQRDFGIYVCNMFDTGQASKVLKLERNSLEYLLHHFCGVTANKEYQNADWRLRPLPDEMMRYAREDTHYLLYIYDLMRELLLPLPNESGNSDTPLVEVYRRSYYVCMQMYQKELLTEGSYLHMYGLPSAGFNAQQLAIVAGLFEWRDAIARAEDESTGYILPNKTLLEIAKHKPVTASQLRNLLKSKHPYVERNLVSVVNIIRHSMQNPSAFEAAVQRLKEKQKEMALQGKTEANGGCEVDALHASLEASKTKIESSNIGDTIKPSGAATITRDGNGGSMDLHCGNSNIRVGFSNEAEPRGSPQQSREINVHEKMSPSAKVTGATVQVLKKPTKGFGALLGGAAAKKKFDMNDKGEIKLEKIRSSVNLPFNSFLGQSEPVKPPVVETTSVSEISCPEESCTTAAAGSRLEDMIVLEEENENDGSETPNTTRDDNIRDSENLHPEEPSTVPATLGSTLEDIIILDDDPEDDDPEKTNTGDTKSVGSASKTSKEESVCLSDLSTSFEKCFQSKNQNRAVADKSEPSGLKQFKPFDYGRALGQVKFGGKTKNSDESDDKTKSSPGDSRDRKKSSALGRAQKDDGTREFLPARRRQAFPASGNRSASFR